MLFEVGGEARAAQRDAEAQARGGRPGGGQGEQAPPGGVLGRWRCLPPWLECAAGHGERSRSQVLLTSIHLVGKAALTVWGLPECVSSSTP